MSFLHKCVCIFLVTASFVVGAYTCDTDDVTNCLDIWGTVEPSKATDLNHVCPIFLQAYNCLKDDLKDCPQIEQTAIDTALTQMESAKNLCKDFDNSGQGLKSTLAFMVITLVVTLHRFL